MEKTLNSLEAIPDHIFAVHLCPFLSQPDVIHVGVTSKKCYQRLMGKLVQKHFQARSDVENKPKDLSWIRWSYYCQTGKGGCYPNIFAKIDRGIKYLSWVENLQFINTWFFTVSCATFYVASTAVNSFDEMGSISAWKAFPCLQTKRNVMISISSWLGVSLISSLLESKLTKKVIENSFTDDAKELLHFQGDKNDSIFKKALAYDIPCFFVPALLVSLFDLPTPPVYQSLAYGFAGHTAAQFIGIGSGAKRKRQEEKILEITNRELEKLYAIDPIVNGYKCYLSNKPLVGEPLEEMEFYHEDALSLLKNQKNTIVVPAYRVQLAIICRKQWLFAQYMFTTSQSAA